MRSYALTRHDALASWERMCRILYRFLVPLAGLAVRSGRSKDLEIIVLRHQLTVLLYRFLVPLAGLAVRSGRSKDLEIIVLRHQLTGTG